MTGEADDVDSAAGVLPACVVVPCAVFFVFELNCQFAMHAVRLMMNSQSVQDAQQRLPFLIEKWLYVAVSQQMRIQQPAPSLINQIQQRFAVLSQQRIDCPSQLRSPQSYPPPPHLTLQRQPVSDHLHQSPVHPEPAVAVPVAPEFVPEPLKLQYFCIKLLYLRR